ncbi:copper amine oxidase N-terminal domain-containing protein [Paenibacillus sp. N3.4]|uniref:copper amine oxidase N-terminal domain-containing protein n=1 Tax=Paenibacillus sp. N3.4 TaxID=2603222 RepID=UPI0011C91E12|nr:copper amine oxidase N-terminal domain-containing protein [Paenibacillus sp. N3.4]TXK77954.1 copper amine oxidase N-terminal domain-containing protein [Paenibacillus sp. N3.4]
MKVIKRVKVSAALSIALIMGLSIQASAAQTPVDVHVYQIPMHFTFDGKEYAPPEGQQGFIYEGSTYVPIRFISYSLDKAVKWDAETYTVTVADPKETDKINISEYKLNTQVRSKSDLKIEKPKLAPSKLTAYKEKISYVFDGVAKKPSEDLPGYIVDGSLYVPVRFFSESVGKTINWDPETYTVSAITSPDKKDPVVKLPEGPKTGTTAPVAGGGGGGGGGSTKLTLDSIKSETVAKLNQLESKSTNELLALYGQYLSTNDPALKQQAKDKIAGYDKEFESIISAADAQLSANDYDKSILSTYRTEYEKKKAEGMNMVTPK